MNGLCNHVQLLGKLGHEVDYKTWNNGNSRARFSIATREFYKDREGEKQMEVQYHTVIGWGNVAEQMSVFLKKGSSVLIQGKLQHRIIGEGESRKTLTEVIAKQFRLIN